jgi:methyl-accepting chemotaxis protein
VVADNEIGSLAGDFNKFVDKIQLLVQQVVGSMASMSVLIQDLVDVAQTTSLGVQAQSQETEQVAAAINEMSATSQDVSKNAGGAAESASRADKEALEAKSVVATTIDSIGLLANEIENGVQVINDLGLDVDNITSMVGVIQGIAEQTNLLALNAAIEAARAGEQGRGFAVVADEVRSLASKTQSTTEEIQEMITRLQQGTQSAVTVMQSSKEKGASTVQEVNKTDKSLEDIVLAVSTINDMNTQIASAAGEQTLAIDEISRSITNIADVADQTASGAQNTENSCVRLAGLAQQISQQLGQFKV